MKPKNSTSVPPPRKAEDSPYAAALLGMLVMQIGDSERDEHLVAKGQRLLEVAQASPAATTQKFQGAVRKAAAVIAQQYGSNWEPLNAEADRPLDSGSPIEGIDRSEGHASCEGPQPMWPQSSTTSSPKA